MKSVLFALTTLAALGFVHAQDATNTAPPSIPTSACILNCLMQAATSAGCDFTDPSCSCTNPSFQSSAASCLTSSCSADEVAQAQALQTAVCGATSPATTGGATETGTSSTGTGTGTGAPQTTTSNAAMGVIAPPALVGMGGVVGGLVGIVGVLVGALVVV